MFNRNSGTDEQEILQNQFTAYVKRAIQNRRLRYLCQLQKYTRSECSLTELEAYVFDPRDSIQLVVEMEAIRHALGSIQEKERKIILLRILGEKSIDEIATEMGLTYRAVTSLYYRGMKKLRYILGGGDNP